MLFSCKTGTFLVLEKAIYHTKNREKGFNQHLIVLNYIKAVFYLSFAALKIAFKLPFLENSTQRKTISY